jgi:hypothetical protein
MISESQDVWIVAEPEIQWIYGESDFHETLRSLENRG